MKKAPTESERPALRRGNQPRASLVRADIQALRAFAVTAVVLYHLWPGVLPGGYVGVDVFFVISGFLITSQLIKRRESGRIGLASFWAARARRLLPASLTVLAASALLTLGFAPAVVQGQYLRSILGSTFYVENWLLAADAVDYLGQDNAPPIAQHYWSLSVEEQFYLVWPLVLVLCALGATGVAAARRRTFFWILAITVGSLALSIYLTDTSPAYGYFSTLGRMWEFGIGAAVALMPRIVLGRVVHLMLWWGAWLALLGTLLAFGATTPFPGPWALLPTVAAALLIAIGPSAPSMALNRAESARPLQWVGDQSYGIYLWHWPLIIIAPAILGRPADLPENIVILAVTVTLAALTKRFIEDPIRFGRAKLARPRTVAASSIAAMCLVAGLALVPQALMARADAERESAVAGELTDVSECRGASALLTAECEATWQSATASEDLIPSLTSLYDDTDGAFACYQQEASSEVVPCRIGSEASDAVRIALTGDSHAAMLIPALRTEAERLGWSIDLYVGRGCVWAHDAPDDECKSRRDSVDSAITNGDYDAVIVTGWNQEAFTPEQRSSLAEMYSNTWLRAQQLGIRVVAVADNPGVPQSTIDCIARTDSFALETCAFSRPTYLEEDPIRAAAIESGAALIDLTDAYCTADDLCPAVEGGVIVYRDSHHITASFSRTLAPYLSSAIEQALK